jgi:hypothetical protein
MGDSVKDLPIIRITDTREVEYVEMDLEMEDDTHAMLVKWGKESATDEDYVNIAMREGIENAVKKMEGKECG